MIELKSLDRLKSQLLVSGLQQSNQPLYQVIFQLIDTVRQLTNEINGEISGGGSGSLSGNSFVTTENEQVLLPNSRQITAGSGIGFNNDGKRLIINAAVLSGNDGFDGEPGPIGPPGIKGEQGIPGLMGIPGLDGEDGEIGPVGPQGLQGIQGNIGPVGTSIMPLFNEVEEMECNHISIAGLFSLSEGIWTLVPYNAANFTTASGGVTWTVNLADQVAFAYMLIKKTMFIRYTFNSTSVSAPVASLRFKIPGGGIVKAGSGSVTGFAYGVVDNGGAVGLGLNFVAQGTDYVSLFNVGNANWSTSTNNTSVAGYALVEID